MGRLSTRFTSEVLCFCASSRSTFIGQIKDRPAVWAWRGGKCMVLSYSHFTHVFVTLQSFLVMLSMNSMLRVTAHCLSKS